MQGKWDLVASDLQAFLVPREIPALQVQTEIRQQYLTLRFLAAPQAMVVMQVLKALVEMEAVEAPERQFLLRAAKP
jgi:hypothetical protein